jgi:hypothetical protein
MSILTAVSGIYFAVLEFFQVLNPFVLEIACERGPRKVQHFLRASERRRTEMFGQGRKFESGTKRSEFLLKDDVRRTRIKLEKATK